MGKPAFAGQEDKMSETTPHFVGKRIVCRHVNDYYMVLELLRYTPEGIESRVIKTRIATELEAKAIAGVNPLCQEAKQ